MAASAEQMSQVGDLRLCNETFSAPEPSTDPILLVSGLGSHMINYESDFCGQLAAMGHDVIRFDNRDVGQSTHFDDEVDIPTCVAAARAGEPVPSSYTLSDMAADAVGLLDALGIGKAHIAGCSMGGMIVQTMAIEHPERVASLCSIMSTTGERKVGQPTPEAAEALLAPPAADLDGAIAADRRAAETWGSPGLWNAEHRAEMTRQCWARELDATGTSRQLAAIWASGSRAEALAELDVATLVVHGDADTLIQPDGGERTAELIAGARLEIVGGMGHDRPKPLWPTLIDLIAGHAKAHPIAP